MMLLFPALVAISVFCASLGLTGWFRRHAQAHHLLDVPNGRSSHTVATPRGGGVAIVIPTLLALVLLGCTGWLAWPGIWGLGASGAVVAAVGFADDLRGLSPKWRIVGHIAAASWALAMLGGAPPLTAMGLALGSSWAGCAIGVVYLVWVLNLTNFMDGIDGIASVETITVCVGGAIVGRIAAPGAPLWIAPLVLAAASFGFLVWNWQPAKIFMGDAGSGFLGLMLGVLSLQAAWVARNLFWSWLVLLGVFVVDATVTLIRRSAHGETFYEAHRSHAYQHAAARLRSHAAVTLIVASINICWLLPIAVFVARGSIEGVTGALLAYIPLVLFAVKLEAGRSLDT